MSSRISVLCTCAALFTAAPMFGWGCHGHQIVALIALQNMTPAHAAATNALLSAFPTTIKAFCEAAGLPPAGRDSTWADDYRQVDGSTGRWHFIDLPFTGAPDFAMLCRSGCVTRAIKEQVAAFQANPDTPQAAEALRFIIHLVGDVHQPMHGISNNDHGGNCIPVTFLGIRPVRKTAADGNVFYDPELHGVWDYSIVDKRLGGRDLTQFAGRLSAAAAPHRSEWASFSVSNDMEQVARRWAEESHDTGVDVAYANLLAGSPARPIGAAAIAGPPALSGCGAFQDKIAEMDVTLNHRYVKKASAAAELRLEQAGIRLAALLDQLWDSLPRH